MKIKPLVGFNAYRAFIAFHKLMLGLKMLPAYRLESYEEFFARVAKMPAIDQERMIREAAIFVELTQDELESLACFATDPNGIPYTAANLKSLKHDVIYEIIVAVSLEISKIKINFVSEDEKKNSETTLSI